MTLPIVLAHGVCRFDKLWSTTRGIDACEDPEMDHWHYFRGVCTMLRAKGHQVFHSSVSWSAGVETRARELRDNIRQILLKTGAGRVNIIAHSMGGLDARHMMFGDRHDGGIHRHIASLTTISTPHWGSPFADWGTENLRTLVVLADKLGMDVAAFDDLTVKSCTRYNNHPEVKAFENSCASHITFQTFAGRQDFLGICDLMKMPFYIIEKQEGENDGLVSVKSARWRDEYFKGCIENADHLNVLGWWDLAQIWLRESEADLLHRIHRVYADIAANLPQQ